MQVLMIKIKGRTNLAKAIKMTEIGINKYKSNNKIN